MVTAARTLLSAWPWGAGPRFGGPPVPRGRSTHRGAGPLPPGPGRCCRAAGLLRGEKHGGHTGRAGLGRAELCGARPAHLPAGAAAPPCSVPGGRRAGGGGGEGGRSRRHLPFPAGPGPAPPPSPGAGPLRGAIAARPPRPVTGQRAALGPFPSPWRARRPREAPAPAPATGTAPAPTCPAASSSPAASAATGSRSRTPGTGPPAKPTAAKPPRCTRCRPPSTAPRTRFPRLCPSLACTKITGSTPPCRRATSPARPTSSPPATATSTPATTPAARRTVRSEPDGAASVYCWLPGLKKSQNTPKNTTKQTASVTLP